MYCAVGYYHAVVGFFFLGGGNKARWGFCSPQRDGVWASNLQIMISIYIILLHLASNTFPLSIVMVKVIVAYCFDVGGAI